MSDKKYGQGMDDEMKAKYAKFRDLVDKMGMDKESAMVQMAGTTKAKLEEAGRNMEWLTALLPSADMLPEHWHVIKANWDAGIVEYARMNEDKHCDLAVIASCSLLADGHGWMHVGISHPLRYPNWEELLIVREIFSNSASLVYATVPGAEQVIAERDAPLKIVNLYANIGSAEISQSSTLES